MFDGVIAPKGEEPPFNAHLPDWLTRALVAGTKQGGGIEAAFFDETPDSVAWERFERVCTETFTSVYLTIGEHRLCWSPRRFHGHVLPQALVIAVAEGSLRFTNGDHRFDPACIFMRIIVERDRLLKAHMDAEKAAFAQRTRGRRR